MNIEVIGINAGLVWNALNDNGKLTLKEIKKATKLKEKEIYAALGWLAREGKISFEEESEEIVIKLIG
ncbi:MAG: winged helix-turn-helix domain-containing protein [Bacteroidaceae bacterium]|nr:winged helix-turn-helix domain-containing protein [Bacteroidaceae bacterium]